VKESTLWKAMGEKKRKGVKKKIFLAIKGGKSTAKHVFLTKGKRTN